jgi:hypothetical protein
MAKGVYASHEKSCDLAELIEQRTCLANERYFPGSFDDHCILQFSGRQSASSGRFDSTMSLQGSAYNGKTRL